MNLDLGKLAASEKEMLVDIANKIGATDINQVLEFIAGQGAGQAKLRGDIASVGNMMHGGTPAEKRSAIRRMAGSGAVGGLARILPATTGLGLAASGIDLVNGGEGGGNVAADAIAMLGGAYGGMRAGYPRGRAGFGAAAGALGGKLTSDVLQALLGGG